MKSTIIYILFIIIAAAHYVNAVEPDSTKTHNLDELVVTGDMIVNKGDHQILYLSDDNRKFGTNALDAVSSLVLFRTSLNAVELKSFDNKEVYILINGVPSTAINLRGYKGSDIKNVEYYNEAPPQYMSLTEGPVVNIIVKKRHDRSYGGYFSAYNAVNTGFGTNQADLTYADSLNQVKVGYYIDYRNITDIRNKTWFDYGDGRNSEYIGKSHYKGEYHNISASYQRYVGKHLFNAKLYSIISPGYDNENRTGIIDNVGDIYSGKGINNLKSRSRTLALDLYYRYSFKQGRMFEINIVNTLGDSYSRSVQTMKSGNIDNNRYDYEVMSDLDNDSYSLVAHACFMSPLWGGSVGVGSRYEYRTLNQISFGHRYKPYSHNDFIYAGGIWRIKSISLVPSVGLSIIRQVSTVASSTSVLPYFRIYSDWWGKESLKGVSVQLTLSTRHRSSALSDITESVTYIDPWYVATGNPALKSYWTPTAKLALCYFSPDGKNRVTLVVRPQYAHNKIGYSITDADDKVYIRPKNIANYFECNSYFNCAWWPVKWLELAPYLEYYTSRFDTPSQKVRFNYLRWGTSITTVLNRLELSVNINSPVKEYEGDLLTRGSFQWCAVAQYKIGNWSVGAMYNYSGHNNYKSVILPSFSYSDNEDWRPLYNLFRLTASYTFSIGRSRKHADKTLNESSSDNTGLGRFNTPEIAR